jgi:LPS export ABC transporter protein LptC
MQTQKSEPDKTETKFLTGFWLKKILKSIAISMIGVALLFSCKKNDIEVVDSFSKVDTLPAQSVIDLETIYTDSGKVKLIVVAPLVERYSGETKNKTYFPEGMKVDFYDGKGNITSWISSKYAIYHEDEDLWEASDSVVAVNEKGEVLNTELLFWNEKEQIIYSPKFVKITTQKEVIFGNGFEADQSFNFWTITKVKGTIYHETEQ